MSCKLLPRDGSFLMTFTIHCPFSLEIVLLVLSSLACPCTVQRKSVKKLLLIALVHTRRRCLYNTCTCTVLKVRMRIEVTRFRNCAAQFRTWVAIFKSGDSFEIGTQFRNFQIAQRNFEIVQIYNSRGTYTRSTCLYNIHPTHNHASYIGYQVWLAYWNQYMKTV